MKDAFTCPKCGGHYFGSSLTTVNGRAVIVGRQCHDQFGKGCEWHSNDPEEGMHDETVQGIKASFEGEGSKE